MGISRSVAKKQIHSISFNIAEALRGPHPSSSSSSPRSQDRRFMSGRRNCSSPHGAHRPALIGAPNTWYGALCRKEGRNSSLSRPRSHRRAQASQAISANLSGATARWAASLGQPQPVPASHSSSSNLFQNVEHVNPFSTHWPFSRTSTIPICAGSSTTPGHLHTHRPLANTRHNSTWKPRPFHTLPTPPGKLPARPAIIRF